jgi:hypothetical protein
MPSVISANTKVPPQNITIQTPEDLHNLSSTDQKVNDQATKALSTNAGRAILDLGMKREKVYQQQLAVSTKEASAINQTIKTLVDLNGKLSVSEKDVVLSDEILKLFKELENAGITLLQSGEKKLPPARMSEVKAQISTHNDRLKTELQTIFSTKIQVMISELNSLLESLKMIEKLFATLLSNIIRNQKQ